MNVLDAILNSQNGAAVQQLGRQFGLAPEQTQSALSALVPALAEGLKQNMSSEGGLAGLVSALASGRHQRYVEDPGVLSDPATVQDGNGILGHVLGSKEVSRQVAQRASERTGIDTSILKRMLPLVAALAMGSLSRQAAQSGPVTSTSTTGLTGMLGSLLDTNRDGSVLDDVAGLAGRIFKGR
jgi:hypothetical protein